jgi:RNA-binding protein
MELTSKQRADLRSRANWIETILFIGHEGVTDNVVKQADDALTARELIKGRVLETAPLTAREACEVLAARTGAQGVQVTGSRFVLYRENPANRKVFFRT